MILRARQLEFQFPRPTIVMGVVNVSPESFHPGSIYRGESAIVAAGFAMVEAGAALVDVGAVRASGNMTMPGMVMSSGLRVTPSSVPGRYVATAEFGMAGAWQMAIDWNGPAGQGSVNFQGSVQ